MDKEAEKPTPRDNKPPSKDDDFKNRHTEELGIKRFAKIQAAYTFVPLLAAAAGAALGYYVLAKPIAKLFPRFSKTAGVGEVAIKKLGKSIGIFWEGKALAEIFKDYKPNSAQLKELEEVWKNNALGRSSQLKKSVEILNLELPEVPETIRFGTLGGTAMVGALGGGIAVGYDQWKKDESARLAAQEVNRDIANLELFKPSDPELLAENKRLHAMVAALPTIDTASAQRQGTIEEKQQEASIH